MTDKTFTDEEIVKALEVCAINATRREGIFTYQGIPLRILCKDALDLINRQKAEIAGNKAIMGECAKLIEGLGKQIDKQKREIARLKGETFYSPEDISKMTPKQIRENYSAIMESMQKWS